MAGWLTFPRKWNDPTDIQKKKKFSLFLTFLSLSTIHGGKGGNECDGRNRTCQQALFSFFLSTLKKKINKKNQNKNTTRRGFSSKSRKRAGGRNMTEDSQTTTNTTKMRPFFTQKPLYHGRYQAAAASIPPTVCLCRRIAYVLHIMTICNYPIGI